MIERKIFAMHKLFGTCGVFRCKDCSHLISGEWHDKRYHKCELYGLSHGEATDWRLSYQACGMFGIEQDMEHWVPILEQLKHEPKPVEPPIDGQMEIGDYITNIRR